MPLLYGIAATAALLAAARRAIRETVNCDPSKDTLSSMVFQFGAHSFFICAVAAIFLFAVFESCLLSYGVMASAVAVLQEKLLRNELLC